MKLNFIEKLFLSAPFWVRHQIKHEARKVLAHVPCLENCASLEIGGGYGVGALLIKHYTGSDYIYSVDVDSDMIMKARRYIQKPHAWAAHIPRTGIEFVDGDARSLPFEDNSFQAAFHFYVLDHIQEWERVIFDVARVLRPGGTFSFVDALFPDYLFFLNSLFGHIPIKQNQLVAVLKKAGFTIDSIESKGFIVKRIYIKARNTGQAQ